MQNETNGYVGFSIFFLIIIAIVILGTYFLYSDEKKDTRSKTSTQEVTDSAQDKLKIEKNQDLIYFTNVETLSEKLGITTKDVVININSDDAKKVSQILANAKKEQEKEIKTKADAPKNTTCDFTETDDLYEAPIRDYAILEEDNYITLIINDSFYNCASSFGIIEGFSAYTFDLKTGKLLTEEDLLTKYNLTKTLVNDQIRNHLRDTQNKNTEDTIDITKTLSNMQYNETYALYINDSAELEVKYIVKTDGVDYNDTIVLN